jgi:hypothetical protein
MQRRVSRQEVKEELPRRVSGSTITRMEIEFYPVKSTRNVDLRRLSFERAADFKTAHVWLTRN